MEVEGSKVAWASAIAAIRRNEEKIKNMHGAGSEKTIARNVKRRPAGNP